MGDKGWTPVRRMRAQWQAIMSRFERSGQLILGATKPLWKLVRCKT